jgi:hypothetical protein
LAQATKTQIYTRLLGAHMCSVISAMLQNSVHISASKAWGKLQSLEICAENSLKNRMRVTRQKNVVV